MKKKPVELMISTLAPFSPAPKYRSCCLDSIDTTELCTNRHCPADNDDDREPAEDPLFTTVGLAAGSAIMQELERAGYLPGDVVVLIPADELERLQKIAAEYNASLSRKLVDLFERAS